MTYRRPEVLSLASAVNVMRGAGKPGFPYQDEAVAPPYPYNATMGAYEADE
jgi:hypothetical protein